MTHTATRTVSYSVFYEPVPEGGYVAIVPALPGCHSQGDTLKEAERTVTEAIEPYLETLLSEGEDLPQDRLPSSKGRRRGPAFLLIDGLAAARTHRARGDSGVKASRFCGKPAAWKATSWLSIPIEDQDRHAGSGRQNVQETAIEGDHC